MSYQALYRVWRPRTFKDVVGQSHITQTLQNAISNGKFSHAYLFSGPRGTGKTSAAKIFAQTINCEKMPTREPCNECAACRGILDGSISDVIEIDAASNTSVDDIRSIRDKVKYASSSVPYKVYIIDEVHMISVNAFNALLKTLEEPPGHVVFILATTEPHKIPLTIISRCQRFDFKSISNKVIMDRLKEIMDHEEIDIATEALEAVALTAEGGMRDALSILDQTISYSNGKIEIDDVLAVTGGVSQHILSDIAMAMYEQDIKKTLQLFDDLVQHGKDPSRFVFDFIYFLRDVLFYKTTSELAEYLERAIVTEEFSTLTKTIDSEWIQEAIVQLTECEQQIKWTNSPKVFVEIAILTITNRHFNKVVQSVQQANAPEVTELINRVNELEKKLKKLEQAPAPSEQASTGRRRETQRSRKKTFDIPHERIRMVLDQAEKSALQHVQSKWASFLEQLKQTNAPAHATIQDSKPVAASKEAVIVGFKYEIHCSLFLEHKEMIESILANIMASHLPIIPIPEEDWYTVRSEYINKQEESEEKQDSGDAPIVEEARKLFGDELLEIRD
ncbi:DNA polymerase III subunit gamma/tau [Pseudogracilibacillus sp. SE30717A]|uniref:DNA polymerase III subunit gamma/tau n=1 Tax=Pseudogracilibacillus sp. SE30717A TaxID=3098293 RepID=UPI00300E13A1